MAGNGSMTVKVGEHNGLPTLQFWRAGSSVPTFQLGSRRAEVISYYAPEIAEFAKNNPSRPAP